MNKTLYKYTTSIDYAYETLLVLSGAISSVSLCSFTTIIDAPIGIASASISTVFLISIEIVKMFLKTIGREKQTQ